MIFIFSAPQGYDIAVFKVNIGPLIGREEIKQNIHKIYPACLPRVEEGYQGGEFVVAGWGLTKSRIVEVRLVEKKSFRYILHFVCAAFCTNVVIDRWMPKGIVRKLQSGQYSQPSVGQTTDIG